MSRALIGSTGFIGSSVQRQIQIDALYHSTNIREMAGRKFESIVCAGAPAAKWKANQDPAADLANIQRLMDVLATVTAERFVLISTVDVYGNSAGVTEDTPVDPELATAYGRHRRVLEQYVQARFPATIIRLPGLFGTGLRKNVVYDLLHGNNVDQIHPEGVFQYYNVDRLVQDISRVLDSHIPLIHFSSEPIKTADLAREVFGLDLPAKTEPAPAVYDMRSKYASKWNRDDGYLFGRDETLAALKQFVRQVRS